MPMRLPWKQSDCLENEQVCLLPESARNHTFGDFESPSFLSDRVDMFLLSLGGNQLLQKVPLELVQLAFLFKLG